MGSFDFKRLFYVNTLFYKKIKCVLCLVYTALSTTMAWYEDQIIQHMYPPWDLYDIDGRLKAKLGLSTSSLSFHLPVLIPLFVLYPINSL